MNLSDFLDTRHNKISYRNRVFIVFSTANINKKTLPRKGKCTFLKEVNATFVRCPNEWHTWPSFSPVED